MARGEIKLHFPDVQAGEGKGFNDGAIDKFIFGVSLIRESIQNSLDQWDESTGKPCIVMFSQKSLNASDFFIDKGYKEVFKKCKEHNAQASDKGDGAKFYENAIPLLSKKKIDTLVIRDYNTNGLHEHPHSNKSSYYRLITAPGTSAQTGRGGGSHGHGQKATFHQSKLRTTFYYSYVEKGIENLNSKDLFVGKSILNAWIDEDGIPMSGVGYFADIWKNPKNHRDIKNYPLTGNHIPESIKRTAEQGTGTDIYILEPGLKRSWIQDTEKRVIDNFFAAIERGMLEVHIKAESASTIMITKSTLDNIIKKHNSDAGHYLKALREPLNGKPFTRDIKKLGNVKLYISQHEGGNQKIAIMRRPRMIIQAFRRITLANFSGMFLVDDKVGSNNLRKAENARHDKLTKELMRKFFDPEIDFIGDLYDFMDDTIKDIRGSEKVNLIEIPGLGPLLPGKETKDNIGEDESDNKDENIPNKEVKSAKIVQPSKPRITAPRVLKARKITTLIETDEGEENRIRKNKRKINSKKKYKKGDGKAEGIIPSADITLRTFIFDQSETEVFYFVKTKFLKDSNGYIAFTHVGEDDINVGLKIKSIEYLERSPNKPEYKIEMNKVSFGEVKKSDEICFKLIIEDNLPASLGVLDS